MQRLGVVLLRRRVVGVGLRPADEQRAELEGVARDDEAIFGRNNRLQTANGATLNDQFSRGVTRDRAAEREFPYECKRDGRRFLTATALSEHLLEAYGERLHPSLIRPAKAKKITDDLSDDE